jgi:hypothetical protein
MADAGAAAIALHSHFEEQIVAEAQNLDFVMNYGAEYFPEAPFLQSRTGALSGIYSACQGSGLYSSVCVVEWVLGERLGILLPGGFKTGPFLIGA